MGVLVLGGAVGRRAGMVHNLSHRSAFFNVLRCLWILRGKDISGKLLENSVNARNEHLITSVVR